MPAEGIRQCARFGIAEFREFARRIDHRAVVLAQLRFAGGQGTRFSSEPRRVEPLQHGVDGLSTSPDERAGPTFREHRDGLPALGLGEESQCCDGEIVVGLITGGTTALGQRVHLARPATSTPGSWSVGRFVGGLDESLGDECSQGAPYGGRGCAHPRRHLRRGGGAGLQQAAGDPLSRISGEFHNSIVA